MCDETGCFEEADHSKPPMTVSASQRRAFIKGLATLPLAAVLADPRLALAAGNSLSMTSIKTPGGQTVSGYMGKPKTTPAGAVLLVHEWWGLNDQIKAVAADLVSRGYIALAVDLYDGGVAKTPDEARALMKAVDGDRARDTLGAWVDHLRGDEASNGKVGAVGWCFGGGWSLNASLVAPVDATVIYYGNVKKTAADLAPLKGPVLGHFATADKWINKEMVGGFEASMATAGKSNIDVHWYEANHGFANPTSARYDKDDAEKAWERTLAFFGQHLG
jgi:carboxymethylenebutenolidase